MVMEEEPLTEKYPGTMVMKRINKIETSTCMA